MKRLMTSPFLMVSLLICAASGAARADASAQPTAADFWERTAAFVKSCAVQPYVVGSDGRRSYGNIRSICPELVVRGTVARFVLDGVRYHARISDSELSDGGDLNDIAIRLDGGTLFAERSYVPAFGDVILALAGGDDDFPLEEVASLPAESETPIE
jgi:hypothetical protein